MSNIVVIAEVRGGQLKRPSLEAATAALQLASATGGKVTAIACGANLDAACAELQKSGVHQITAIEGAAFANYSGDAYAKAIADQAKAAGATGVLMAHTAMGKDLLPRVAALLEGSITTDAVAVSFANGSFMATEARVLGQGDDDRARAQSAVLRHAAPKQLRSGQRWR
jgi:electron transfer flavoprotein alpha subunit